MAFAATTHTASPRRCATTRLAQEVELTRFDWMRDTFLRRTHFGVSRVPRMQASLFFRRTEAIPPQVHSSSPSRDADIPSSI